MTLEYGFGVSFTTVPTWTAPGGSFDFASPIHTATAAALDGNGASNRTAGLGGTLNNLGWTVGSTLWVRWVENNDAGNDHALAVDNIRLGLPAPFFGDYNQNGIVDADDYVSWRKTLGQTGLTPYSGADGNGNGMVDADDYAVWRAHFGQTIPPPAAGAGTAALASAASLLVVSEPVATAAPTIAASSATSPAWNFTAASSGFTRHDSGHRSATRNHAIHILPPVDDQLLVLLGNDRVGRRPAQALIRGRERDRPRSCSGSAGSRE